MSLFALCCFSLVAVSSSEKILLTYWACAHSHALEISKLGRELASRGHEVHALIDGGMKEKLKNHIGAMKPIYWNNGEDNDFNVCINKFQETQLQDPIKGMDTMLALLSKHWMHFFSLNGELISELKEVKYDMVVGDGAHTLSQVMRPLVEARLPTIYIATPGAMMPFVLSGWPNSYPAQTAFAVQMGSQLTAKELENFSSRVKNFIFNLLSGPIMNKYQAAMDKVLAATGYDYLIPPNGQSYSSNQTSPMSIVPDLPPLAEVVMWPPGIKVVGPFLPEVPDKPLPEPYRSFVKGSKVILLSMGSWIKLSEDQAMKIIKGLKPLVDAGGYKVIWRNREEYPEVDAVLKRETSPEKWMLARWIPQNDLLAHENVVLFIGHGGHNGVSEAAFHGVPMIVLPHMGDQFRNGRKAVDAGFGLCLKRDTFTEMEVKDAVNRILIEKELDAKADLVKRIFQASGRTKEAADWVEYAINTDGAYHLFNPRLVNSSWIVAQSVDVASFLVVIVLLILYMVYKLGRTLLGCCCGGKKKTE